CVVVDPRIPGNVKHPGPEPAVFPEGSSILQHPKAHVLNEVVRECLVPGHPGEKIEKGPMVPIKENRKFGYLAVPYRQHQVFVCFHHSVCPSLETATSSKGYRKDFCLTSSRLRRHLL